MLGALFVGFVVLLALFFWRLGSWDVDLPGPFLHKLPLSPTSFRWMFDREYNKKLVDTLVNWHAEFNAKSFHFNVMGTSLISTTDLAFVEHVLNDREVFQTMSIFREAITTTMGPSMFMSEGDRWSQKHKALQPLLHIRMLRHNVEVVNEKAIDLVNRLKSKLGGAKKSMEIFIYIRRLFVDVIGEVAFGAQFYDRIYDYLQARGLANDVDPNDPEGKSKKLLQLAETLFDALAYRLTSPKFMWNFGSVVKAEAITLQAFKHVFQERIAEFKEEKKQYTDENDGPVNLLSLLDTQKSELYPPEEIMGECFSFFMAGHDTTASTSGFVLGLLAKNPTAQAKLREEVKQILAEKPSKSDDKVDLHFNFEDVSKMKYGHAVIKEAMRLYPVAPGIPREATRDTEFNGMKIKRGTVISLNSTAIMRSEEYYENPLEFVPERWLSDHPSKVDGPYVYLPFGTGSRSCFGQRFAVLEMKVLLCYMVHYFQFQVVPEKPLMPENIFGITLKDRELWVAIQPLESH